MALPLIGVIATANIYVGELAHQSEQLITRGVRLARQSKALQEKITAMERNVRQYQVLGDVALVKLAEQRNAELIDILDELDRSRIHEVDNWHLDQMRADSQSIMTALHLLPPKSPELEKVLDNFKRLREHASVIRSQGDQFINNKSEALQQAASSARHFLLLMAITLIPAVVLMAIIFTVIITRPMRQVERAIRSLGSGRFNTPIRVTGPHELAMLGERLDWLRNRLATLEAEQNQFLRRMSHELKTPLASIREGAEQLIDGTAGALGTTQKEIVGILHSASQELQFLIENLLNYEEWREQPAALQLREFDLAPLLESTLARHQLIITNKRLHIQVQCEPLQLLADPDRIRMMFDNLLSNAIKFAPRGGRVDLQIKAVRKGLRQRGAAREIVIDIADNGPGIAAADRQHIFEPFYQGKQAASGYLRGSGIGLSVVHDCVVAHSGRIELIEGEHPGAHFRIHLPSGTKA